MKPPICAACQVERGRWLDSKPSQMIPRFGIVHGSGAPHDVSAAGLRDKQRERYETWRTLVRNQMALVATQCRAAKHATSQAVPAVVQLDLFELIGGPS